MRRMPWLIGGTSLALAFVVGCTSLENKMVYYPRSYDPAFEPPPNKANEAGREITLTVSEDKIINARWYPAPKSQGAVLYCPGNAGNLQLRSPQMVRLGTTLGQSVLIFDYPGYGKSSGTPSEKGCYEAAAAAYQWLIQDQKISPERIVIYGESLGGAVAVDLATKQRHAALVLERTFTSIPDVADYQMPLLPASFLMTNRFDSLSKIPQCRQPVFIAAGDKDALIPMRQAEQLKRACTATSELFVLKGVGHTDPLPTDYYAALASFLVRSANVGWANERGVGR